MNECRWGKVAVVNVSDAIGQALLQCFLEHGSAVLAIDETRNLADLPARVEALGLRHGLNDVAVGQAVLQGLERWGIPDVLVNNFGTSFLARRREEGNSSWSWGTEPAVQLALAATVAYATLRQPPGAGLVLNVGAGSGLIPEGCPMHYSLLGIMRSLELSHMDDLQMANVCLHNISGQRPECQPCAEQVLRYADADDPKTLYEMVCSTMESICKSYE